MKKVTIFSTCLFFASLALAYESYIVISPEQSRNDTAFTEEDKEGTQKIQRQIKEQGYYEEYSQNAVLLNAFKDKKGAFISKEEDPYYSILRLDLSDFSMSFPFNGISSVDEEHLLGFAPSNSLEQGQWTGVTAYFNDERFGTCKLIIFDLPSSNGQTVYDSRYTTYQVNGKPTTVSATGNADSGFISEVSWTGARYEKMLKCADKKPFNRHILNDMVKYAQKIDNDLPDSP